MNMMINSISLSSINKYKRKFIAVTALLSFILPGGVAQAEPWVDTSNIFLKESIQRLSDSNVITTPVNTYPLMWQDIAENIRNTEVSHLSETDKNAYYYVLLQLRSAKRSEKKIEVNTASDDNRFTSFGDSFRDNNNISISRSWLTNSWAGKLHTHYNPSPLDGDKVRYSGTYLSAFLGNWVVTAGLQDRWWGPSWDTSLVLTNNARPMPALSLSRKSAVPFNIPFTQIDIPWTVTSFMGIMDDDRVIEDTLLWGFRLNFKPTPNLEIGINRLAQWGGEGRSQSLDTFVDLLLGNDNCGEHAFDCGENNEKEPGNQMAGYDIRWSTSILGHPFNVNFTMNAEDGDSEAGSFFGEEQYQLGFDTHINIFEKNWRIYVEATDTYATCADGHNGDGTSTIGNCYYEHHTYNTGMRYKKRNIASIYDNDARTGTLGMISQVEDNTSFEFKFRWLQLNLDNSDKAPGNDQIGNTVTEIAENMLMLSGKVQHSYRNWRYTFGSHISKSQFDNDIDDDHDIDVFLNIEYKM